MRYKYASIYKLGLQWPPAESGRTVQKSCRVLEIQKSQSKVEDLELTSVLDESPSESQKVRAGKLKSLY